jgi:hypothetical protein
LDYSGGQVTDWGGHHPDIAQWGMDTEDTGPVEIINARGEFAKDGLYNTAKEGANLQKTVFIIPPKNSISSAYIRTA